MFQVTTSHKQENNAINSHLQIIQNTPNILYCVHKKKKNVGSKFSFDRLKAIVL